MNIANDTPRADRSIGGITVTVPQPYAEGHVLTAGEASQLNQVLAENVSNNLRKKIELGQVSGEGENQTAVPHTTESAQNVVDSFLADYEMGVRRGGSGEARVTDPVEKEARAIAKQKAIDYVKSQGLKPKDVDLGPIVEHVFTKNKDVLMKEGTKIVKAREAAKTKSDGFSFDGLDLGAPASATDETAAA